MKSIWLDINTRTDSPVLTDQLSLLWGELFITDKVMGKSFRISPLAFYQVNSRQMKKLYQTAISFAELTGSERIVDAYCGIGTIGICASDYVSSVIGIENNPSAVKDARANSKANGLKNTQYICGDAARLFLKKDLEADVFFLDPPRAGSSEKFLTSLLRLAPERIVYISCNPITLLRDLKILTPRYRVAQIQPVDMFPFASEHIETVCSLARSDKMY